MVGRFTLTSKENSSSKTRRLRTHLTTVTHDRATFSILTVSCTSMTSSCLYALPSTGCRYYVTAVSIGRLLSPTCGCSAPLATTFALSIRRPTAWLWTAYSARLSSTSFRISASRVRATSTRSSSATWTRRMTTAAVRARSRSSRYWWTAVSQAWPSPTRTSITRYSVRTVRTAATVSRTYLRWRISGGLRAATVTWCFSTALAATVARSACVLPSTAAAVTARARCVDAVGAATPRPSSHPAALPMRSVTSPLCCGLAPSWGCCTQLYCWLKWTFKHSCLINR